MKLYPEQYMQYFPQMTGDLVQRAATESANILADNWCSFAGEISRATRLDLALMKDCLGDIDGVITMLIAWRDALNDVFDKAINKPAPPLDATDIEFLTLTVPGWRLEDEIRTHAQG